jgi:hypothetical protein
MLARLAGEPLSKRLACICECASAFDLALMSSSANMGRASRIFILAALNICSEGGIEAARLVFSVRRVMKNMNWLVLICISAKLELPAGMPVCFLHCG